MLMKYGCIGEKLGHSFSPALHAMFGNRAYELLELTPAELPAFFRERAFLGVNVTIPYKEAVLPYLDEIDPVAAEIGAVNTVVCRDGRLYGYNTDFAGMKALFLRAGIPVAGAHAAVLGGGGTSRTARAVLRALGARSVTRVSRRPGEPDEIGYDTLRARRGGISVLVNTTPVGMFPREDGMAADPADFPALRGALDAVYNPLRSDFVLRAQAKGVPATGGLYMLAAQAAAAHTLFTGEAVPTEKLERVCRALRDEKENIVLLGMPGAGKTTLGRLLAAATGRPFFDSDREVEEAAGAKIPDLFGKVGEAGFRAAESEAVAALSGRTGAVIATGGGVVLREENVRRLRRNGRLIFLDRPIETLTPTAGRPLSRDRAALWRLFAEREPLYRAAADLTLTVGENERPEETLTRLLRLTKEEV